ncbi:MAG: hypothetical protein AB4290_10000 [Spirulina sp.]
MAQSTDFSNFALEHPNYFPGQYLLEDDFELQHKYLADRQCYSHQSLHISGIVEGLEVEVVEEGSKVRIAKGSAIDPLGQLIVLKAERDFEDFQNVTTGELYIQYGKGKHLKQQEEVPESYTRWKESPMLGFAETAPPNSIKLAVLTIEETDITVGESVRNYSGIALPNPNGKALMLRSEGKKHPNGAVLTGSLKIEGDLKVEGTGTSSFAGSLKIDGELEVKGTKQSSFAGSLKVNGKIHLNGSQQIAFTDEDISNNLKLQLWTGYGLGINGSTLFYTANGFHSWRDHQNQERMSLGTGVAGGLTVKGTGESSFAGSLRVEKKIEAGNSDIYFTKTDHDYTGFGSQHGFAAIQNAKNHNALMILGRYGTSVGRLVKLWDYLQVNGMLTVHKANNEFKIDVYETGVKFELAKGASAFAGSLKIVNSPQDANGDTLILGDTGGSNLRMGYANNYSWIQSHGGLPLAINPIGNNVGIGTNKPSATLEVTGTTKLAQLEVTGTAKIGQEGWKTADLQNGWKNYHNGYNSCQYFKDSCGIVHLKGLVKLESPEITGLLTEIRNSETKLEVTPTTDSAYSEQVNKIRGFKGQLRQIMDAKKIIFGLKPGYQPVTREVKAALTHPYESCRVDIDTNGQVLVMGGHPVWVSLDNISFRAQ